MERKHPEGLDAVAMTPHVMSAEERRWTELIRSRAHSWESEIDGLAANFAPVAGPDGAVIAVGNRGGEDAFGDDGAPATIAFDVSRLQALYGDAGAHDNAELIDRLFRHEYTHLLQRAWLAAHPYLPQDPLEEVLLDVWKEGLGNYYSLSAKWHARESADAALAELTPRLIARIGALACAASDNVPRLRARLTSGPFAQKWGALPIALWLDREAARSPRALRDFIVAGPNGVLALIERHVSNDERAVLREALAAAALCRQPPEGAVKPRGSAHSVARRTRRRW
jgi:hypothetical protein